MDEGILDIFSPEWATINDRNETPKVMISLDVSIRAITDMSFGMCLSRLALRSQGSHRSFMPSEVSAFLLLKYITVVFLSTVEGLSRRWPLYYHLLFTVCNFAFLSFV